MTEDESWPQDWPRYRVLVYLVYDHGPGDPTRHPDGVGHDYPSSCARGYDLAVTRLDVGWLDRGRASTVSGALLGVTRLNGPLSVPLVRSRVIDWLRARAAPRPIGATPRDVDVYLRLEDAP